MKTTNPIFMKILPEMYLWIRKSPLNFGSHLDRDPDPRSFCQNFRDCDIGYV